MLEILYSDAAIAVIVKPEGLISEEGPIGRSVLPAVLFHKGRAAFCPRCAMFWGRTIFFLSIVWTGRPAA